MKKKHIIQQVHPIQGVDHFVTVAECPRCHSMRIHKRKGFHFLARWRCRKCHKHSLIQNGKSIFIQIIPNHLNMQFVRINK